MNKKNRSEQTTQKQPTPKKRGGAVSKADSVLEGISLDRPPDLADIENTGVSFRIHIIPQAHIDLAWMWTREDGNEMILSTFRHHVEQLEQNSELTYAQSQLYAYRVVEIWDPQLFERLKRLIRRGQWEVVGGQWVEPDNSIPSGESHIRQLLWGQRYARNKLHTKSKTAWCPDSFSEQPSSLVDMYVQAGMDFFVLKRPREKYICLPVLPFWWTSPSGKRILSQRLINKGTGWPSLSEGSEGGLGRMAQEHRDAGLCELWGPLGCGDVGGKLTFYQPDEAEGWKQCYSLPHRYRQSLPKKSLRGLPQLHGNLGPIMTGCMTTHVEMKLLNRQAENTLQQAECAMALANILESGSQFGRDQLDTAWGHVLFNQFHDIATGVGYKQVHRQAQRDYEHAVELARNVRDVSSYRIAQQTGIRKPDACEVLVFNSLGWARDEWVCGEVDLKLSPDQATGISFEAVGENGKKAPVEIKLITEAQGQWFRWRATFLAKDLPAFGYKRYTIQPIARNRAGTRQTVRRRKLQFQTDNLCVTFDPQDGFIRELALTKNPKVAIRGPLAMWRVLEEGNYFLDYGFEHRAWHLGLSGKAFPVKLDRIEHELLSDGFKVTTFHSCGTSTFRQDFYIRNGRRRIDVRVRLDWHEIETLARLSFNVASLGNSLRGFRNGPYQISELPGNGYEHPMQTFCAARAEKGVLSISNNGRYGCSFDGENLTISAIRCATYPDPRSDEGTCEFEYSIHLFQPKASEAEILSEAYSFNVRPWLAQIDTSPKGKNLPDVFSAVQMDNSLVLATAMKPSEARSNRQILRLFNPTPDPQSVSLTAKGVRFARTNILEESARSPVLNRLDISLKPFEIESVVMWK